MTKVKSFGLMAMVAFVLSFLYPADSLAQVGVYNRVKINVSNLEESVEFYRDVLGLKELSTFQGKWMHLNANFKATTLCIAPDCSGTKVDLVEWKNPKPVGPVYPYFFHQGFYRSAWSVGDLDAHYDKLVAQGVEFIDPPNYVYWNYQGNDGFWYIALFKDPDGIIIEPVDSNVPGDTRFLGFIHTQVTTPDLDESRAFWEGKLGFSGTLPNYIGYVDWNGLHAWWSVDFVTPPGGGNFVDVLEMTGDCVIAYGKPWEEFNHLGLYPSFRVDNLDQFYEELVAQGVQFVAPPDTVKVAGFGEYKAVFIKERFGAIFELVEGAPE